MRDQAFTLTTTHPGEAMPPFRVVFIATSAPTARRRWRIVDAAREPCGHAPTRAGARAGLRALYARPPKGQPR